MAWEEVLAKEFKKRDNKSSAGPLIGTVLSKNPVKVSIADGKIMLTKHNLRLADGSEGFSYESSDSLMLIPDEKGQIFFIINKLGQL